MAIKKACTDRGLWPIVTGNRIDVTPPCVITSNEAAEGVAILDELLAAADKCYEGSVV